MAQLLTPPILKFTDANGDPLAGGKLYSYAAGTTTPLATYTDQGAGTPNANPVILDANGECQVWISSSAYKFVLKDSSDVTLWTVDQISTIDALSVTTAKLSNGAVTTIKIADLAVTTAKIEDLAVTEDKLADDAVTTDKIEDGAVTLAKLASGVLDADNFDQVEIVFKNPGDFSGQKMVGVPQYPWSAPTKLADPSTPPVGAAFAASWSPNGEYLLISHTSSPYISIYQRSGDTLIKLANPTTLPGSTVLGAAWSPCGNLFLTSENSSPFINIYRRNGSTFSKLPDPASLPAFGTRGVSWSPTGEFLALATSGSPYITIYQRSFVQLSGSLTGATDGTIANVTALSTGDTYTDASVNSKITSINLQHKELQVHVNNGGVVTDVFTKLSDPASLPAGSANGCSWSPSGEFLVVTHSTTPFITIYQRSGTTFTKLSNPNTLPAAVALSSAWSPDSQFLAVTHDSSPYLTIYQRSGTTFTKLSNPSTLPTGDGLGVAWSPNGIYLAVGHETTPYITIYERSGTTFTKLTNPVALPAGDNGFGVDWSSDGRYLATTIVSSPYFSVYKSASTPSTNAFLFVREVFSG